MAETPGAEFRAQEAEFRAQEAEFRAQEAEFCAQEAECGGSERLGGLKEFLSDGGKHAGAFWQIFALPRKRTGTRSCPENYADGGRWLGWRCSARPICASFNWPLTVSSLFRPSAADRRYSLGRQAMGSRERR